MRRQTETREYDNKTSEELLIEIRNMLTSHREEQPDPAMLEQDVDHLLHDTIKQNRQMQIQQSRPSQQVKKIDHINKVLHNQDKFVRNYAKEKILSEMFTSLRPNIQQHQLKYYQRQREQLLRQREAEEQEERDRESRAIESRKKFVSYDSRTISYKDIHEFTMKEGKASIPYLLNQAPQAIRSSANNNISLSTANNMEAQFEEQKINKIQHHFAPPKNIYQNAEEDKMQFIDSDNIMSESYLKEQTTSQLFNTLKKSTNFVRAFKYFLINQINLYNHLNQEAPQAPNRISLIPSESSYHFANEPIIFKGGSSLQAETTKSLTKKYKNRNIVLQDMDLRSIEKEKHIITEKTVSKMVGDSQKYHPKRVTLTEKQLIWIDENQVISEQSKRVNLIVQDLKIIRCRKEEGGFFSSTSNQIDVVHIRGSNRDIKIQKNFLQGKDIYDELCVLMAQKVYKLNIIISCKVNEDLLAFISDKNAHTFNLSNQFLQAHQKYPSKDYRIMIINILTALFQKRREVHEVQMVSCKLNTLEINTVVKQLGSFQKLEKIAISETKFNAETMIHLTKILAKISTRKLDITLSNCLIDDNMLIKSRQHLSKCTNISKLNLSLNDFTMEGFAVIIDLCSQSQISELNINRCRITNLIALGQLIKKAKTMEVLLAEQCGFSFESNEVISQFFLCCRNSRLRKLSLLRNDVVNNLKPFEDFWVNDTPKQIFVDVGIFNEKTSKNLQGKLL